MYYLINENALKNNYLAIFKWAEDKEFITWAT